MDTTQTSTAGRRVVALMFPQPTYKGPSRIEDFTPASFAEIVEDRSDSNVSWLVEFFAPWAPQCLYLEPVIAELSLQYSSPTLRFGKIDVSRWPALAKRYKISIRGEDGNQLPTLIMFENGKERGRIPHVYNDGKVAAGKFRKNDIVTAFALGEKQAGKSTTNSSTSLKKKGGMGPGTGTGTGGKKKN
ncbi:putative Thioredoxin-related transmembrane protein 2 [Nannochloris sp. 'desiccata']|nr:putative Thioredoxin-related transmembrane protein 2 [Chlorella desiccata (nom. nud.)]